MPQTERLDIVGIGETANTYLLITISSEDVSVIP